MRQCNLDARSTWQENDACNGDCRSLRDNHGRHCHPKLTVQLFSKAGRSNAVLLQELMHPLPRHTGLSSRFGYVALVLLE